MTRVPLVLALLSAAGPAVAASPETAALPWGDWLSAALSASSSALVPVAAAAVTAGIARTAPWASSILTRERVEAAIRAGVDYGQNAVSGAMRGRSVAVSVAPAVVAEGTRHVLATAPARVVRGAGGAEGVAARIFRALPLDAQGSAETVLEPALRLLKADPPRRG
ncbi:hypothetical protein [Methylobacterium sp. J-067]|uniref:hypothetical protein n=1 Tax=Methylobacterium sp. J-067 TaxID=2836648 RepID=UPI001FBBD6AA|nr:hypothetical protein [Methylobacterium sp. J-067]MCJ2027527.1 hypothetical protein [Methylobacterium sp. J-067]